MLTTILLTILITENIFLILALVIWLNRHCKICGRVKCIERMLNKICFRCQDKIPPSKTKQQITL